MFPLLPHKVLFFEDESKRAELVRQLNPEAEGSGQHIAVTQMREKDILGEALTREQRAQIVETFIRHAFSEVTNSAHLVSYSDAAVEHVAAPVVVTVSVSAFV